jgi:hypothetical protein
MRGADVLRMVEKDNPREVLLKIVEENPEMEKGALFEIFRGEIGKSQSLWRAVQWYFFINMYEYHATTRHISSGNGETKNYITPSARLERRIIRDFSFEGYSRPSARQTAREVMPILGSHLNL